MGGESEEGDVGVLKGKVWKEIIVHKGRNREGDCRRFASFCERENWGRRRETVTWAGVAAKRARRVSECEKEKRRGAAAPLG